MSKHSFKKELILVQNRFFKNNLRKLLLLTTLLVFISTILMAQDPAILSDYQGRAKIELEKNDISVEDFKERLLKKGIDLDKISPEQLLSIQKEIEITIAELIAERYQQGGSVIQDSLISNRFDSLTTIKFDSLIQLTSSNLPPSSIYGHQIFRNKTSKPLNDSTFTRIPDTYILGTGDVINVSIFGASQFDATFKINEEGYIKPAQLPKILLKGLSWDKAQRLIQSRFSQFYLFRKDQFALGLSKPRDIIVNIFGEVEKMGSYSLSAGNTAFNALFAADGPTELGSVRNIKIINGGKEELLDVYEVINDPIKQFSLYLEDNAIIQVPIAQKIVSISGAIQRPLKYELKEEEGFQALVDYAGDFTASAVQELIQIRRYENGIPVLKDVNWTELKAKRKDLILQNGDSIIVRSIDKKEVQNAVRISGAVELPGDYALNTTPRVSDLIRKAQLMKQAALDVAFLSRINNDGTKKLIQLNIKEILENTGSEIDLLLLAQDELSINEESRFSNASTIQVKGAVKDNIEYPFDPDSTLTVQSAIFLAGGLMPEAAELGYIIRTNENNTNQKEYIRVAVKSALATPSGDDNIKLRPLDELIILANSSYTSPTTVAVSGAVRFPSEFQYSSSLTLKDAIYLSGGLEQTAATNRIEVFRLVTSNDDPTQTVAITLEVDAQFNIISGPSDFKLMPYDEIIVRKVPDYEEKLVVEVKGEVLFPGKYALVKKNETLANVIRRTGGLTEEAFIEGVRIDRAGKLVITDLTKALSKPSSTFNYLLKAGDIIRVPKKKDLVTIKMAHTGSFDLYPNQFNKDSKISVAFAPGKTAKWYIEEYAAGFGGNADKSRVAVKYPNGAIKRTKGNFLFKQYPKPVKGSTISIGAKQATKNKSKEKKELEENGNNYPKLKKGVIISLDGNELKSSLDENKKNGRVENEEEKPAEITKLEEKNKNN